MKITCVILSFYVVHYLEKRMLEVNSDVLPSFHHSKIYWLNDADTSGSSGRLWHVRTGHHHGGLGRPTFRAQNHVPSWRNKDEEDGNDDDDDDSEDITSPRRFLWASRHPASAVCLGTRERTCFYPKVLPDNSLVLGNISVRISDPILASILKAYYNIALLRINRLTVQHVKDLCFHSLNSFMFDLIGNTILPSRHVTDGRLTSYLDVHLWKLWTVIRCRLHKLFTANRVLPVENGRRRCDLVLPRIVINIESGSNIEVIVHENMNVDEALYIEEGCLEFFESSVLHGLGDPEDDVVDLSDPVFTSNGDVLFFLDHIRIITTLERLPDILVRLYGCKMLEISSIRNRNEKLCHVISLRQNLELFITKLKKRLVSGWGGLNGVSRAWIIRRLNMILLLLTQETNLSKKTSSLEFGASAEPSTELPITFMRSVASHFSNYSSRYGDWASDSNNHTVEVIPLLFGTNVEFTTRDSNENNVVTVLDFRAMHSHIVFSVIILLGVLFLMVVFVGLFITWLYCVSRISRLRRQQSGDV